MVNVDNKLLEYWYKLDDRYSSSWSGWTWIPHLAAWIASLVLTIVSQSSDAMEHYLRYDFIAPWAIVILVWGFFFFFGKLLSPEASLLKELGSIVLLLVPVILGIIRLKLPAEMPPAWYTAICAIAVIFLGAAFVISLVSYTLSIPGEDKTKGFATRALRLISAVTFGFGFVLLSASETKDYWTLFSSKFPIRPVTLLFILLALSACIFSFLHIWFSPRSGRILKKIGHAFLNVIKTIFLIVPTIMVAYLVFFQIYTAFVAGGGVLWGIVVIVCTLICIALSLYLYLPTAIYLETFTDLTFRNEPRFGKLFVLKEEPEKDSTGKQEKRAYDWRGALLRATLSIDYPLLADFHFCNYQPQATVVGPFGFLKVYVEYKSTSFPGNEQLLEMVKTQLDKALDDYSQMSQGRVPKKYRVFLKVSPRWESDDTEFTSFPVTYTFTFRP